MSQSNSIEEAISHGDHNYWDEQILASGRSGGTRCPKCKKWTQTPRKRKNPQPVYLSDCELCEIKDPFERMWHEFNRCCDDDERKIHNQWLAEVIDLAGRIYMDIFKRTSITDIMTPYHGLKDGIIQDLWERYFENQKE